MNIKFEELDIEGFRSIDRISLNLSDQGIVIVKGINNYEDLASSNGSGKSSVFEAIIYALFEETSSGDRDIENRILGQGCSVVLKFSIDGVSYKIIRQSKKGKGTVVLYRNDEDISARNKSDTNKLISIYNIVTLDSRLSIGMHDIDKISGNVNLKIAGADEKYTSITGEIKTLNQNQYVYTDKKNIIFKLEVYQNPKTFVTETTKNIFITVQGNEATSAEYLMEVASEIIHLITTYCGGNAQIIYK